MRTGSCTVSGLALVMSDCTIGNASGDELQPSITTSPASPATRRAAGLIEMRFCFIHQLLSSAGPGDGGCGAHRQSLPEPEYIHRQQHEVEHQHRHDAGTIAVQDKGHVARNGE